MARYSRSRRRGRRRGRRRVRSVFAKRIGNRL